MSQFMVVFIILFLNVLRTESVKEQTGTTRDDNNKAGKETGIKEGTKYSNGLNTDKSEKLNNVKSNTSDHTKINSNNSDVLTLQNTDTQTANDKVTANKENLAENETGVNESLDKKEITDLVVDDPKTSTWPIKKGDLNAKDNSAKHEENEGISINEKLEKQNEGTASEINNHEGSKLLSDKIIKDKNHLADEKDPSKELEKNKISEIINENHTNTKTQNISIDNSDFVFQDTDSKRNKKQSSQLEESDIAKNDDLINENEENELLTVFSNSEKKDELDSIIPNNPLPVLVDQNKESVQDLESFMSKESFIMISAIVYLGLCGLFLYTRTHRKKKYVRLPLHQSFGSNEL